MPGRVHGHDRGSRVRPTYWVGPLDNLVEWFKNRLSSRRHIVRETAEVRRCIAFRSPRFSVAMAEMDAAAGLSSAGNP
jgi:hypothetical protein